MAARRRRSGSKGRGPWTLALDVGGTDLKGLLLDRDGRPFGRAVRVPTPVPATPGRVVAALRALALGLGPADRGSIGFPGVIDHGRVRTAVNLKGRWVGMNLARRMERELSLPVRVANDADIQGLGAVRGRGVELVITLGTGFGSALFVEGILVPNLEMGHHPFRDGRTYEQHLGLRALRRIGVRRWNRVLEAAVDQLRRLFNFRRLYVGGGNARLVRFDLPRDVTLISNRAGLLGGIRLWEGAPRRVAAAPTPSGRR